MKESGKTRHDFGREEFIKKVWEWKEKHGNMILNQLRRVGASLDWEREFFTMDPNLSEAVADKRGLTLLLAYFMYFFRISNGISVSVCLDILP